MYVPRDIEAIFSEIQKNRSLSLTGPRQSGKTTLLEKMLSSVQGIYLTFDDPDVLALFNEDIKKFCERHMQDKKVVVLDEVQYAKESGRKIKYMTDVAMLKVWISGSSEYALSKETLAPLGGRVILLKLFPFSLNEFLTANGMLFSSAAEKKRALEKHMIFGGYPAVVLESNLEIKKMELKSILKLIIEKDVSLMLGLKPEEEGDVLKLVKVLALQTGSIVNLTNVANSTGISYDKIKQYCAALEKAYILKFISPFHTNKLKEIVKAPKVFFIDTGIRNAAISDFRSERQDIGAVFENYVFSELLKAGFEPKYWQSKGNAEVDFVIEQAEGLSAIEVKHGEAASISRGVHSFIQAYAPKKVLMICNTKKRETIGKTEIIFTDIEGAVEHLKGN